MVAAAKVFVEATKNSFVVPHFVAVTKPFFFSCKNAKREFFLKKSRLCDGVVKFLSDPPRAVMPSSITG